MTLIIFHMHGAESTIKSMIVWGYAAIEYRRLPLFIIAGKLVNCQKETVTVKLKW